MSIRPFADDRKKLLSLLHVRAAYPPSAWAIVDTEESLITWIFTDEAKLYYNAQCVKMYGDDYGSLVD